MGIRFGTCICCCLLILSFTLSTPADAWLFDAANIHLIRAETMAVDDLDGDGSPDIVTFREGYFDEGWVEVSIGRGDGTFRDPVNYSVADMGYISRASLVIGDLNEDGDPDLAVMAWFVNEPRGDIWVLLNNGDGTFVVGEHDQVPFCAEKMLIVDLDGDGHHDLAVVHSDCGASGQDGWLSILYGRGDGTFEKAILHDLVYEVLSLAAGDFNGDGAEDLVLVEFQNDAIMVLLGNGDGTFQAGVEYPVGDSPYDVASGDLDADGWLDLAVANRASDTVSVLMGLGDGSFQAAEHFGVAEEPFSVEISDIDNDLVPELVTTSFRGDGGDVSVLIGEGDGTFEEAMPVETGERPDFGAAVADFDGDGNPDIVAENGQGLSVVLGHGDGTFAVAPSTNSYPGYFWGDAGDVNADGNPDIVLPAAESAQIPDELVVLLGRGDGTFGNKVRSGVGNKFDLVAVGDLNRDGYSDAVSSKRTDRFITVHIGGRDGGLQETWTTVVGYNTRWINIDDLNHDGNLDLVVGTSSNVYLLFGHGDGTCEPAVALVQGAYLGPCAIADLNHDGNLDLALADGSGHRVSVMLGIGDGTFSAAAYYTVSGIESVAVGDLDEDGHPDLAVNSGYTTVGTLSGNGDGTFQEVVEQDYQNVSVMEEIEYIADLDLDGHLDLVIRCNRWIAVLRGNGDATFRLFLYGIEDSANIYSVSVDDLDNDGDLDLVATKAYRDCRVSVLLNSASSKTISGDYTVSPISGTLPFPATHQVVLRSTLHGSAAVLTRRASVSIDAHLGGGAHFSNWRAGYTNLSPNEVLFNNWTLDFPASPSVVGANIFSFQLMDTTPAPYNQPPYPPSGDTVTRSRMVIAAFP